MIRLYRLYRTPFVPLVAFVAAALIVAVPSTFSAEAQPVRLASTGGSAAVGGPASNLLEGTATFYHPIFDGKQTASGEVYDHQALTAAHKSLPFNTMVRVTHLATGRQVVVRINDRLPVGSERTIDLSGAAASRLDMLKEGIIDVRLELLEPVGTSADAATGATGTDARPRAIGWSGRKARPERSARRADKRPAESAPSAAPASSTGATPNIETRLQKAAPNASNLIYTLQIGSFTSLDGARALAEDYETAWIAEIDVNGRPSYRVYYSRFEDEEPARLAQQSLWQGGQDSFLRRIGS